MKNFRDFSKYLFLALGLLVICGCETIQDVTLTETPSETDTAPVRVTMIYPSDCVGDSAYCDTFHSELKRAEAALGINLTEVNRDGKRCRSVRTVVKSGCAKF